MSTYHKQCSSRSGSHRSGGGCGKELHGHWSPAPHPEYPRANLRRQSAMLCTQHQACLTHEHKKTAWAVRTDIWMCVSKTCLSDFKWLIGIVDENKVSTGRGHQTFISAVLFIGSQYLHIQHSQETIILWITVLQLQQPKPVWLLWPTQHFHIYRCTLWFADRESKVKTIIC